MIIKVAKDCRVVADDGLQFVVQVRERIGDKSVGGKVSERAGELSDWRTRGYHGTLAQAMQSVLKLAIMSKSGEKNAKELIAYIETVARRIDQVCEGVVGARAAAELDGAVNADDLDELFAEVG